MRLPFPRRRPGRRRPYAQTTIRQAREQAWLDLQQSRHLTG